MTCLHNTRQDKYSIVAKSTIFQSNILSSVYIDDYILIHGPMSDSCFLNSTLKALIITIADDIFCNNFLHFGYNKTLQNQLKLIEKQNHFFTSRNRLLLKKNINYLTLK